MSGSSDYHLEPAESFERTIVALERATYGRKDTRGRAEFREVLGQELEKLFEWPRVAGCKQEPFPSNIGGAVVAAGWTFHKVDFSVPRANGAARQGRLMLLVHNTDRVIVPFYVYTHAQFPGRVPDRPLRELVEAAVSASQKMKAVKEAQVASTPMQAHPELVMASANTNTTDTGSDE